MKIAENDRLVELAQFLRTRRQRILPEQVGLQRGSRRRTPGLRRSEVAFLSNISVDWYTWLEQGRDIKVSPQVLDNLAKGLQLNESERKYLYHLALQQTPVTHATIPSEISPSLQVHLDHQGIHPAFIIDSRWNMVAWNKMACYIYGNYKKMSKKDRNVVWRAFTSPLVKQLKQDQWENYARDRLAQFRANYAKNVGDTWWITLIEDLHEVSEEFRKWWQEHDVLDNPEGKKIVHHPIVGKLAFKHLSFHVCNSLDLMMTINVPLPDYNTEEKLQTLWEKQIFLEE